MVKENNTKRPLVSLLSTEFIERIVGEAKDILEKVGVWVENDEALELLGSGGARIDREKKRAYIPERLVEESLKSVPSSIKLYDRNGSLGMNLEGNDFYFIGMPAPTVWDSDLHGFRESLTRDAINHVKLVDALDNIDAQFPFWGSELPKEVWDCHKVFLSLRYSTKPVGASLYAKESFEVFKDLLVAIRGSEQALREKPLLMLSVCPSPPLKWADLVSHALIRGAENGLPVILIPMPLSGATAPVTIGGCVVQHAAENLTGVVISQLVNRGLPVIWGGSPVVFDMHWGTTPLGALETVMMNIACNEVGKYLGMPTGVTVGCDAKRPDSQSGLEMGMGTILASLSGANVISGQGMLNFENTQSLEKMVIDNEICGMARRLVRGITPRGERLAEDLFNEGLYEGDHFLLSPVTMKWFREEFFYPGLVISRKKDQVWIEKGATTAEQRATEEVKRILATHQPEPLDKDVDRELIRIMTRAAAKYGMDKLPL
jgi:trimethylamine--corrinoid protein Co-methyltransferase